MNLTKTLDFNQDAYLKRKTITKEQLQREFDYYRAQKLLEKMLEDGLISQTEYKNITHLNRKSFMPSLAHIMP